MAMLLYQDSKAPNPRRVRMFLVEKGLAAGVELVEVSINEKAHQQPAYLEKNPFFEVESYRVEERYGHVAHVFSTYESRRAPGEAPFTRGINSFQLFWDGTRWWVVTIFWNDEQSAGPIPAQYLPKR